MININHQRHAGLPASTPMARLLFAGTTFTSALLLFLVQPLMSKQTFPWFDGSAVV